MLKCNAVAPAGGFGNKGNCGVGMTTWLAFWDSDHSVYVSERHKSAHADLVLTDIRAMVPDRSARVLDFGCGEARYAEVLATCCGELVLCEAAAQVRARLAARLANVEGCRVIGGDDLVAEPAASFDLIVVNSVLQYIARDELPKLLARWHGLLARDGRLVLADIVQPDTGPLTDAISLLRFAWRDGFLTDAIVGLGRMAVSDYRRVRGALGLATYRPEDLQSLLLRHHLQGTVAAHNIGHNQARFTIAAQRLNERDSGPGA